jgi:hypothetical protein
MPPAERGHTSHKAFSGGLKKDEIQSFEKILALGRASACSQTLKRPRPLNFANGWRSFARKTRGFMESGANRFIPLHSVTAQIVRGIPRTCRDMDCRSIAVALHEIAPQRTRRASDARVAWRDEHNKLLLNGGI